MELNKKFPFAFIPLPLFPHIHQIKDVFGNFLSDPVVRLCLPMEGVKVILAGGSYPHDP